MSRGIEMEETKVCTKCGIEKPISEFKKDKRVKSGITSACRSCYADYMKTYKATHPEFKERQKFLNLKRYHERYYSDPTFRQRALELASKSRKKRRQKLIEAGVIKPYDGKTTCCGILKKHHEDLKDDPEHLATEFIKTVSQCRCNAPIH